jgi:predicted metal-dependent hydrolase
MPGKMMPGKQMPGKQGTGTPLTTHDGAPVEVRRSARRRRTVAAFWENGTAVVAIPAHFSRAQEADWVHRMLEKLRSQGEKRASGAGRRPASDAALAAHAAQLSARYLGGRSVPTSVRWVSNQNSRWGSATPADGSIRLSDKLRPMPQWVIDYVLLHELAHLLVAGHNAAFWKLLEAYPETERAKAFLEGVSFAMSRGLAPGDAGQTEAPGQTEEADAGRLPFDVGL